LLATVPFIDDIITSDKGAVIGYSAMLMAFLLVYFGIRSYRDNEQAGRLTFGKGLLVGTLITIVSSLFYVAAWEFVYFKLMPDFWDRYSTYAVDTLKKSGASAETVAQREKEMKAFKATYDQPLMNAAFTLVEPLPVGLLVTLVSAAVLRKTNVKADS